jgi:hypothetical protein
MTYWDGFVSGVIVGFFTTLIATGRIIIGEYPENLRSSALLVLLIVFIFGLFITFYQANQRKSLISPSWDGFITGMGFIEAVIIFAFYGFKL